MSLTNHVNYPLYFSSIRDDHGAEDDFSLSQGINEPTPREPTRSAIIHKLAVILSEELPDYHLHRSGRVVSPRTTLI